MINLWIFLALIASISSSAYTDSREQEELYEDYYLNDLDQEIFKPVSDIFKTTIPDLFMKLDQSKEDNVESSEVINYEDDNKFEEELDQYLRNNKFDTKDDGNFDDYQFEDNRSEIEEGLSKEIKDGSLARPLSEVISNNDAKKENEDNPIELSAVLPKTYEDADKSIFEETKSILGEDTNNEFYNDKNENVVNDLNSHIFEETSMILEESNLNENTGKYHKKSGEEIDSVSESVEDFVNKLTTPTVQKSEEAIKEDSADKVYEDLMSELVKLDEPDANSNDFVSSEKKLDKESSEDYEEIDDKELDKIFENHSNEDNFKDEVDLSNEKLSNGTPLVPVKKHKVLPYLNDALVASEVKSNLFTSTISSVEEVSSEEASTLLQNSMQETVETTQKPKIDKMAIAEEDNLMRQFIKEHQSVYDVKASDVRNAFNIRLTVDTPVEVTSPDYPLPYPTNNTVDWMFTGDGLGIELNITDFSINGHLGDYLLVKPGGVDESGSTGLIFTYNLRTQRRYRFLDVDKMFVRFFANRGNQFMRGFKFSVRMVVPRPNRLVEPEPEPEPIIPEPPATITLNLGGISLQNFLQVEEQFRNIIADMATLYINTNGIDPGVNTTLESTQITSKALCFHNWPKFELCTEVQFGVPLVYEEEKNDTKEGRLNKTDLLDMWSFYSQRDPFAVQLRMLGITEYQVPDDAHVLTLWLVVAGGVVLSAALLALALWRFSCFEDYTRMPVYGDTESIAEKRTLDLYPTPHQTLPPLYTETDYKWAEDTYDTDRVDMGFTNKSFLRGDAFEAPGAIPSRDRNFSFSPRDIYV